MRWEELIERAETHRNVTYYRNPTEQQFVNMLAKMDLRGLVSGKDVYVWDAAKQIHHRAATDLSLPCPDYDYDEDSEEGFTPTYPFYAHSPTSSGDWEWEGRLNVGDNVYVLVIRDDYKAIMRCARFVKLARTIKRPI